MCETTPWFEYIQHAKIGIVAGTVADHQQATTKKRSESQHKSPTSCRSAENKNEAKVGHHEANKIATVDMDSME